MIKRFKSKLATTLFLYLLLLVFLLSTNPNKLKIGWLILPFILLFAALFRTALIVTDLIGRSSSTKKRLALAGLVALVPTAMLLLDSIDQLTLRDGFLLIFVAVISIFYVSKFQLYK